jgi:hypothetical protein
MEEKTKENFGRKTKRKFSMLLCHFFLCKKHLEKDPDLSQKITIDQNSTVIRSRKCSGKRSGKKEECAPCSTVKNDYNKWASNNTWFLNNKIFKLMHEYGDPYTVRKLKGANFVYFTRQLKTYDNQSNG